MLRATALIFLNDLRLLARDRIGFFMLILAPAVIIAVAGFSLGNIYDASPRPRAYVLPILNQDDGAIGAAIVDALKREPSVTVAPTDDVARVRAVACGRERAPVAILIPPGTTAAVQ